MYCANSLSRLCLHVSKIFSVYENIFTTKKSELRYIILQSLNLTDFFNV